MMGDVENLLVAQDAPGDPRQFVGQGGCQLVAMQPWRCVQKPCSEAEALPIVGAHQNDFCGLDEQGPEVLASSLGDATQDGSTTCAVLAWHETKPCAEVSPALECLAGANGSDHGGREKRADTGNAHEALAVGFLLTDRLNLASDGLDSRIDAYPVFVEPGDQAALFPVTVWQLRHLRAARSRLWERRRLRSLHRTVGQLTQRNTLRFH
jgi:hypothetical protein